MPMYNVFGIFSINHDIHVLRMLYRRGNSGEVADRAHASVEVEKLPQCHVERADAAPNRGCQWALDRNPKIADSLDGFVR